MYRTLLNILGGMVVIVVLLGVIGLWFRACERGI